MLFGSRQIRFCMVEQCDRRTTHSVCPQSALIKAEASAELFVASMQRDPAALSAIRSFMWTRGVGASHQLSSQTVIKWMASQLASGRIRICDASGNTSTPVQADPGAASAAATAPGAAQSDKPFPLAARSQPSPQKSSGPASEQSGFPADVQLATLAQTLK